MKTLLTIDPGRRRRAPAQQAGGRGKCLITELRSRPVAKAAVDRGSSPPPEAHHRGQRAERKAAKLSAISHAETRELPNAETLKLSRQTTRHQPAPRVTMVEGVRTVIGHIRCRR